jgi:lipoate-protein ligase A
MAQVRVLISDTHNPWFNLATEEWIFREMDPIHQTLFLWRNAETVVIGRNQNPWSECNLSRMEEDGIRLARRTSGGGAVFHDLGNTCFTFLSPRENYDRAVNTGIVLRALNAFGVSAESSGRNDIVVTAPDGLRKVSGSAFRETRDRAFHHGTLLLKTDLARLGNYLTPHPKKLESKGRASVRARVMNLSELTPAINHEVVCGALIQEFHSTYGSSCEIERLEPSELHGFESLRETFAKFSSWDWRFGHAPRFSHHLTEYLSWGLIEVFIDSDRGLIERAQVFSDALDTELILNFCAALPGCAYGRNGIEAAVTATLKLHPDRNEELLELQQWLKTQVEVD